MRLIMKILKRMLLINWHYINKQIIEFENINFLTGKNGSGKSTILDALQLLILGDTRGNFFNKAANDKTNRTLDGYLKGEIGDDGDVGYRYIRNDRFSSYIVCEFFDKVTRKYFSLGVVFDVYKDSDIEYKFFSFNNKIPENEFINEQNIPYSYKDLKSYFTRHYGNKNYEFYSSNKQYQDALRGKLGGLNQKFFNLFKKAVTFTPINDIEKFIVEYVCDVKNKIDIASMQENIRQYNNLSKQVEIMKIRENELQDIENTFNSYEREISKAREEQYLIWRAEKQIIVNELENLNNDIKNKKSKKETLEEETKKLENETNKLSEEINELRETRAKSDIEIKRKELVTKINQINLNINRIDKLIEKNINLFRNQTLKWNANLLNLEKIKNHVKAKELDELNIIKDLLKYLDNINENNFSTLEITAAEEIKQKIEELIKMGNTIFFATSQEYENDCQKQKELEEDIKKLEKGINPYEQELINFKLLLENKLKEKYGKEIKTYILADLLEIKNQKWQNAIEGYLNTQKKYLIIEPEYFETASKIYRELANNNDKIHSFGLVDIEKIQKENSLNPNPNSLAMEILTQNTFARIYIDYLLGRVIKCDTIEELRNNKISITSDCMLYQGYVLRKINPALYKYPIIGKEALEKQKLIKIEELENIKQKINKEQEIINIMGNIKQISNFSEGDISNFSDNIKEAKNKENYVIEKQNIQSELDGMDMFWLNNITNQISQKEELKLENEKLIKENNRIITEIDTEIKIQINEKIPEKEVQLEEKTKLIDDDYTKEWQESVGEEKFGIQCLKRLPEKIFEIYTRNIKSTYLRKDQIQAELIQKRSDYNTKYQFAFNIQDGNNIEFSEELRKLREIALPEYLEKIEDSRKKAYEQFRIEFLDKLKSNIDEVKSQIKELNNALTEHKFGTDTYIFRVTPKQEYKRFYDMLQDELLLGDWGIGQLQFNQKYAQEIKELFDKITSTDLNNNSVLDEEYEKNIREYTDYRTYLNFDLIVKDQKGNEQRLSKTLLKKSGGETQTPFYIAILASFAQVYRIKNDDNTIRLIVFDEAFSKMDSERIEESIKLLRKIGFQAIFAAPPEKLQDIQSLVDSTLLVLNPEEHEILVKKYTIKEEW